MTIFQSLSAPDIQKEIQGKAHDELQAMMGKGSSPRRAEYLLGKLVSDATEVRSIIPMLAGTVIGQLAKGWLLTRLASSSQISCMTRGLGAKFLAGGFGMALEVPAFALSARALRNNPDGAEPSLAQDFTGTGLSLGALALAAQVGTRLPAFARPLSGFLGLMAARKAEVLFGIRRETDDATAITDTLGSLVSLSVGAHLGQRLLGPGFLAIPERELSRTGRGPLVIFPKTRSFQTAELGPPLAGVKSFGTAIAFKSEASSGILLSSGPSGEASPKPEMVRQYWEGSRLLNRVWHQIRENDLRFEGIADIALAMAQVGKKEEARSLLLGIWRSAEKEENEVYRAQAQGDAAEKLGNLGMALNDPALILEASKLAEKIGWAIDRAEAEGKIAVNLGSVGLVEEARSLIDKAYLSATLIEFSDNRAQSEAQIAENLAELGLVWKEPALVVEALGWAGKIEEIYGTRSGGESRVALKHAELGVALKDPALIIEASQWAGKIKDGYYRSLAQSEIAVKLGEVGFGKEARALIIEAWQSAVDGGSNRSSAESQVAEKLAEVGVVLKDHALIVKASRWAGKIVDRYYRYEAQKETRVKLGDLGIVLQDPTLIKKAFQWVKKIKDGFEFSRGHSEMALRLAELGMVLKDPKLIFEASLWAKTNEMALYRSHAQGEIAMKLAELGHLDEARTLLLEASQSAGKIESELSRSHAQSQIALKLAGLGLVDRARSLLLEASRSAGKISDWRDRAKAQGEVAVNRAKLAVAMIQGAQSQGAPGLAGLKDAERLSDSLQLLKRILTTTSLEEEGKLRREVMKQLATARDSRDFRILTTALQACEDNPSAQRLIEMVRGWEGLDHPLFPQLLSRLIKTKNPKGLILGAGFLGKDSFQARHSDRPWQYRVWLVKKLEEVGYLDKGLSDYLKENGSTTWRKETDIWIRGVVGRLGLTPSLSLMQALLEHIWTDKKRKHLTTPDAVLSHLVRRREAYRSYHDSQKLMWELSRDPRESFFYYLLFGGRTQFALINKYTQDQFQEMVKQASGLGAVHEGIMKKWEGALDAGGVPGNLRRRMMSRLRKGQWPLEGDGYARAIRIDVSSEKQLEGFKERLNAAFSQDQLGLMIETAIARGIVQGELEEASGLNELQTWLTRMKEATPGLKEEIQTRIAPLQKRLPQEIQDPRAFRIQVEKDWRQALKNKKKELPQDAPTEEVAARYVESLMETIGERVALPHREEWKSHLREIFEGLGRVGGRRSEGKERRVTLRYLDKSKDLVEVLRFADAAQCCFTSEHGASQAWIARIWKDPLSFVFLIEDNEPEAKTRQAIGFVFGSFGVQDRKPAVLLNGVYLQGKTNEATLAVLNGIEEDFSRPLGAAHQLVAASHGGATHLDAADLSAAGGSAAYTNRTVEVTRLRALSRYGEPEREIYDDIGVGINQEAETGGHVWVKPL